MSKIAFLIISIIIISSEALPTSFSWANVNDTTFVSTVRNQNYPKVCQSGWAISALNVLNSRIKIKRSGAWPDISLSSQVLLQCDQSNFGCMGGDPRNAFRWIQKNYITDQSCNSYIADSNNKCTSLSKCMYCGATQCVPQSNSKIYGVQTLGNIGGQDNIMQQIFMNGPISCGIAVTDLLRNYTNGIFEDKTGSSIITHFVTVYGWGQENGKKYWNVLNSWGPFWGESGHFRIIKGINNLGIESQCAFATPLDTWTEDLRNKSQPKGIQEPKKKMNLLINQIQADQWDWRTKNSLTQSRSNRHTLCSSSWAFALTNTMSDRIRIGSAGRLNPVISPQVLLNCGVGNCSGGTLGDAIIFASKYGLPQQGCQNYVGVSPSKATCTSEQVCSTCTGNIFNFSCSAVKSNKLWRIPDHNKLTDVASMKKQISSFGPIACGMYMSSLFLQYKGGIFSQITILPKIDYYVQIVGYGISGGEEYWIGRNSFGTSWGESGYFRIQMHKNNLGIQSECYRIGVPI